MEALVQDAPGRDRSAIRSAERALGAKLAGLAAEIEARLETRLVAVLLVGSFGRGEGGWVQGPDGLVPHNDVDLVVVVEKGAHDLRDRLREMSHELSRDGYEIDLWPVDRAFLKRPPRTLLWLDIALGGQQLVWGSDRGLALDSLRPRDVPLDEAARLLANRATGVALSNLRGQGEKPLRARRHLHKAVLAAGDAWLLTTERYAGTVRERAAMLVRHTGTAPTGLPEAYADAARFRSAPDLWRPSEAEVAWANRTRHHLARWHMELESRRLGTALSPATYAQRREPLYALGDLRLAARVARRIAHRATGGRWTSAMHPRERLARASVALAYAPDDASARIAACEALGVAPSASNDELARRLEELSARGG